MDLSEYARFDAVGLAALVRNGDATPKELAELALAGVEAVDDQLNAVIETFPARCEAGYLSGRPQGPLTGVPYLNKDLSFPEKGSLMEMGSQLMAGHVSTYDSVAIERLREAGLVNMGRTTTPEFGLVGVTESRIAGITRNPWDLTRTPSGSSGGSAAAVAAGIVPIATASDVGGSIRGPAANCGLVGLKPTRGRVTLGPGRAESNSGLGVVFALTKTVRDTALLLDLLQGPSFGDPPGPPLPNRPYVDEVGAPSGRLRVAYSKSLWGHERVSDDVSDGVENVLRVLEDEGHIVEEVRPDLNYDLFLDATMKIWSANLAYGIADITEKLECHPSPENLQSTTWEMLKYGRTVSAVDLLNALSHFFCVSREVDDFFSRYDLLVTPSSAMPAQEIGAFLCDGEGAIDLEELGREIYQDDGFYPLYNTTGQPAISLPLHQTKSGLPVGIQFAAAMGNETLLVQIASLLEQAMPWSDCIPPIHVSGDTN